MNTNKVFRHFRNGHTYVLLSADARLEADKVGNAMAVYQSDLDGQVWIRPTIDFYGMVEHNGQTVRRFQPV